MWTGFERYTKKTRRAAFLEEMNQVVPWADSCTADRASLSAGGEGRRPKELEQTLRIYFVSGSTCRTRRSRKRCMTRWRCAISWASNWAKSRTRPRC